MPTSTPAPLKTTTADAETTATATPPPCDTCSTKCSASCITACKPAKPSTRSKHSDNHAPHPANRQRLDSERNRRSVDAVDLHAADDRHGVHEMDSRGLRSGI